MPFAPTALTPVFQSQSFSLWHYRSTDTRDQITTVGYFAPARTQLRVGDVIIAQASDALSILPVRSNAVIGTGVNLDGAVAPIALTRTVAKSFQFVQQASAVVTTIILAPLLAGLIAGTSIPVSAQVVGPISQVVVSIRDAQGQLVPPRSWWTCRRASPPPPCPRRPSAPATGFVSRTPATAAWPPSPPASTSCPTCG
ncbi:hypothetical protein [Roseococcus microcysteis]|uniref:hypothetical protein n=1 Tax=Roseococcus microcysteis TaxID=2771361 RepID=UPI00168AAD19|nr:hypothetical protein [Roseococcus microcysteis]